MGTRARTVELLAWLRGHPKLTDVVFDGRVDGEAPQQYVLVFPHRPAHDTTEFAGRRRPRVQAYTIHSVGASPGQAEWAADWVADRLTPGGSSVRLTVDGVVQGPILSVSSDPLRLDAPVFFYADEYEWEIR